MKLFSKLAFASAVIGAATSVNAQTVVDITGSTAGRSAVHAAIRTVLANETFVWGQNANNNATLSNTSKALFKGDIGGTPYTIRTSWSGSAAGVRDVAANNSAVWFANTAINTVSANNTAVNLNNATVNTVQDVAEIAFSDVFQSSTIYTSPALVDNTVGIIPFKFYASPDAPTDLTNISPLQARYLWGNGFIPLAMLTGDNNDQATFVYPTGRDPESGTRITTMAEIGYGVFNPVFQVQPTIVSGVVTAAPLWPAGTYALGDGGYSSGGGVKTAVEATAFGNGLGLIGYVGSSDWSSVAKELSYNGNLLGSLATAANKAKITEGVYTFWGYLHQMRQSSLSGNPLTFFNALATAVESDTTWLVRVTDMQVERTQDGGLVAPLY